ncbi:hypothetical protein ACRAWD_09750 [Caulobacter segnis]
MPRRRSRPCTRTSCSAACKYEGDLSFHDGAPDYEAINAAAKVPTLYRCRGCASRPPGDPDFNRPGDKGCSR